MTSYTVKISVRDIVEMDHRLSVDYGTAVLLDERLRAQGAPHVGSFLSHLTWRRRIFRWYESISSTFDATNSETVYTFRLRSDP